ncbi:MAG: class I SAM-dependent methyltransferase [Actinomycetota bacterium]|nr:class I SAM-dependent methyltransferase [Actinomycetota bacterium]
MDAPIARPVPGDAFGAALLDTMDGEAGTHIVERDDGFVDAMDGSVYFLEPDDWSQAWPETDVTALDLVDGRILDVGAGAGRFSLALQSCGHEPVALDVSPGAVEVCRRRGVHQTFLGPIDDLADTDPPLFDAAVLMGNNLSLLGSAERSGPMLNALRRLLRPGGIVVGACLDAYATEDPVHLAYHQWNRERDRSPGQLRLRVRYRALAGDWFDWLLMSPDELAAIVDRAGWRLDDVSDPDPYYLGVLRPG